MSVWILHQRLTPEEEERISERTHLRLPFDGITDLSVLNGPTGFRHLLRALHPDEPPESIDRRVERIWQPYSGLHVEDIIAVPLQASQELALAEMTGPYQYRVEGKEDVHLIPVRWYPKRVSMRRLGKHKDILQARGLPLYEVVNAQARIVIRDKLPHKYNRFVKFKWILVAFFTFHFIKYIVGLITRNDSLLQ